MLGGEEHAVGDLSEDLGWLQVREDGYLFSLELVLRVVANETRYDLGWGFSSYVHEHLVELV